jgi:CRISPR/Cas system CMR-associated protein Cmr1 (group 7 of RAMP superfamily)
MGSNAAGAKHTREIMQYQISFRKITESDLSANRPSMPEDNSYEMHLSSLIEHIHNLDCVAELNQDGNNIVIAVKNESDFELLRLTVKDLLKYQFHNELVVGSGFSKVV